MRERLLIAASALARLVMVVVAFGLAVGSIGLASVRGFCPEVEGSQAQGQVEHVLAAPAGTVHLATIVEEPTEGGIEVDPNSPAPDPGQTDAPLDQQTPGGDQTPSGEQTPTDGTEDQAGSCPGGAQRCLPPMLSSILIVGDPICHDQAGGRLRAILVPAFVGSTVLLAGAWWLRPSRLQERLERLGALGSDRAKPRT